MTYGLHTAETLPPSSASLYAMVSHFKFMTLPVCALGLLLSVTLSAQNASDPRPAPEIAAAPEAPTVAEPDKRVFGVLPNYRTAQETGVYTPITSHQKLVIATKDTIDYPLYFLGAGFAGLAQLSDQHPDFGQGLKGYAHRWGTAYADQFTGNYLTEGFLPILFHEDPRYFRRGEGKKWGRTGYAASRIFVTKTDSGKNTFNFAEVVGNGISAGISNAYYPTERGWSDNTSRLATALATDAISQILKEFWPDVKRRYFSHRQRGSIPVPARTAVQSGS
jgi:hypothetical protein